MFAPTVIVTEQGQRLKHHAGRPPVGRHVIERRPRSRMSPEAGRLQPGEHADQRALAAARGPDNGEELAEADVERDAVDRRPAAKAARNPAQRQGRRRLRVAATSAAGATRGGVDVEQLVVLRHDVELDGVGDALVERVVLHGVRARRLVNFASDRGLRHLADRLQVAVAGAQRYRRHPAW